MTGLGHINPGLAVQFLMSGSGHISPATLSVSINVHNFALSENTNHKFNSFTKFDGVYFGADESGIKMFHGYVDKDGVNMPVVAEMETGSLKFDNSGSLRRVVESFVNFRSDTGDMFLGLINEENIENRYKYSHNASIAGNGAQRARIKFDRGIKYEEAKLFMSNAPGVPQDIIGASLAYETLSRKSRNDW